jgi:hypothetical protein
MLSVSFIVAVCLSVSLFCILRLDAECQFFIVAVRPSVPLFCILLFWVALFWLSLCFVLLCWLSWRHRSQIGPKGRWEINKRSQASCQYNSTWRFISKYILSFYLFIYLFNFLFIYLFIYLFNFLFIFGNKIEKSSNWDESN